MSESKYTPGPWEIKHNMFGMHGIVAENGAEIVSRIDVVTDEEESNARLIATAPELLEALEAIHRIINLPPGLEKKTTEAIKKARGNPAENK